MRKSGASVRAIWAPRPAELAVIRATFVAAMVQITIFESLGGAMKNNYIVYIYQDATLHVLNADGRGADAGSYNIPSSGMGCGMVPWTLSDVGPTPRLPTVV